MGHDLNSGLRVNQGLAVWMAIATDISSFKSFGGIVVVEIRLREK
jgi:hypothetical protein